jgi:hypothetical protein
MITPAISILSAVEGLNIPRQTPPAQAKGPLASIVPSCRSSSSLSKLGPTVSAYARLGDVCAVAVKLRRKNRATSCRGHRRQSCCPGAGHRTHQGEFMGMAPSGKHVDVQLIDIIRFDDDGLAREHWGVVDLMTMMQQLGAIPAGPPAYVAEVLVTPA